ncbi:hypothetical protein ACMDCO_05195 [Aerococcus urinaeequi]|uniref:hypothetical protein n=1 Tax=Aerococcus urinaeequi TaxID=51665 RepID=UPI0039BC8418
MSAKIKTPKLAPTLAMTGSLSYSSSYMSDTDSRVQLYSNSLERDITQQADADFINTQVIEEEVSRFIQENLHKSLPFHLNIYKDENDYVYVDLTVNEDNAIEIYNYSKALNELASQKQKNFIFVIGE